MFCVAVDICKGLSAASTILKPPSRDSTVHGAGNRLIKGLDPPPFKASLNLQSHPKQVLC